MKNSLINNVLLINNENSKVKSNALKKPVSSVRYPNIQSPRFKQRGFTLVELMISLVLGLLISAAVIQVFITSQRVDRIQAGGSDIQDKAIFGVQAITQQLRLANLGNAGVPINDLTAKGGVVLTAGDATATNVNVAVTGGLNADYLTKRSGLSNTNVASDQLTIQYTNTTGGKLYDCEGATINEDDRVIERYFIKEGPAATGTRKNLNLACDAGRITVTTTPTPTTTLTNFGATSGNKTATIIENVDQFNISFGVQQLVTSASGVASYEYADMTVPTYKALTVTKPYITSVRFAILARSTANSPEESGNAFTILGTSQTLKTETNAPKYLRRVYESNVLIRNARLMSISGVTVSTGS